MPRGRQRTQLVTEQLQLGEGGSGRFAIVSDTHSKLHEATLERLRALKPEAILHAGDIGTLDVLDELGQVAPVKAVRGNIDSRANALPDDLCLELKRGDQTALKLFMTHIAVYGPRLRAEVARKALDAGCGLVVCGHSHVPFVGRERGLIVFNPGSVGPRRFTLPIVFGVLEFGAQGARLGHYDCETGEKWVPPA